MISFILSAVVLIALALLFVLPSLLKKNVVFTDDYDALNVSIAKDRLKELKLQLSAGEISEAAYQQLQHELESTLAIDLSNESQQNTKIAEQDVSNKNKLPAIILLIAIPVVSAALYSQLGDFNLATDNTPQAVSIPQGEDHAQMTIEEAVVKLQQRLTEQPENPDGWFMLGKTYMSMAQYAKAATAYEKVIELVGEDPQLLLAYADALAMTEGGSLTGAAKPVVEKVMSMMPDNPTVLWMAGTAESQQSHFSKALEYWYKLRPMLSQEIEAQSQLDELITAAESRLGTDEITQLKQAVVAQVAPEISVPVKIGAVESGAETDVKATATAAEIIVSVDLDPALKDRVSATDTVFIFAKALQGPPMPLAALKQTVADLPLTVTLNDAMAMMPQMKLSNFAQVKVSAVISKSGQPGAQAGDLFAEVSPVSVTSQEKISLLINQVK